MTTSRPSQAAASTHVPSGLPYDLQQAYAAGPLLRVAVGSRLHGFAHANSDHDYWVVVREPRDWGEAFAARKSFQSVEKLEDDNGNTTVADVTVVGLTTFMHYAQMGVPQALEVMYAPHPEVDLLGPMRQAFRANPNTATASYRRMMTRVLTQRTHDPKQRRHAFRMALNLNTLLHYGRFNPVLTAAEKEWVLDQSSLEDGLADRLSAYTGLVFTN